MATNTSKDALLDLVKKRLKQFSDTSTKTSGLWKPSGEHTIRLIPYKFADFPFIELYFHYDFNKKNLLSPISFDRPDPIVEFAEKLKAAGDKESFDLSRKISPKMRTYVAMIVRGEEDQGVRFYGMGKTVYEEILKIMDDPDYGNIFDPRTGTDLVVTYQTPEEVGNDYGKTSIRAKRNTSRLSESDEGIENLLNNQKPITDIYKELPYEDLNNILKEWLNKDDDEEASAKQTTKNEGQGKNKKPTEKVDENVVAKADDAFTKMFNKKPDTK